MEVKKIFRRGFLVITILVILLVIGGSTTAKAIGVPTATLTLPTQLYLVYNGADYATWAIFNCLGDQHWSLGAGGPGIISATINVPEGIKSYNVTFFVGGSGGTPIATYNVPDTGVCGGEKPEKPVFKASCNKFYIDNPIVKGEPATFTFKGNFKVDSLYLYFPKINLTLYPYLISYDWGTRTWTGTFNSSYLPQGKHHGRLYVSYEGIQGKSCPTGGIKVVAP